MAEKLEIYDLDSNLIDVRDRKEFYKEIKEEYKNTGKITRKVKSIRLILLNSAGRIFLQKRSKIKSENPGLYDKSVGGHVKDGDGYDLTVVKECAEELGFPATMLRSNDFNRAINDTDLNIIGVFREVDFLETFISVRVNTNGDIIKQPHMTPIYIGYYDGPIKFVDGESSGVEVFSLNELEEDIQNNPDKFTEDLKFMVNKYREYLVPIQ